MRLLIYTHSFAPKAGGVESYTRLLGEELTRATAEVVEVTLLTPTPPGDFDDHSLPFRVVRTRSLAALWRSIRWAGVVHLAGPVFVPLAFSLLQGKPVVVRHHGYQTICPNGLLFFEPTKSRCPGHFMARRYHTCLRCNAAVVGWPASLRMLLLTFPRRWLSSHVARNIHNTRFTMNRLGLPRSVVLYHGVAEESEGALHEHEARSSGGPVCFAYVGRLVSEKGLPVLIEAARRLRDRGYTFHVTIIGEGPEQQRLESMIELDGLADRVDFVGVKRGRALFDALAGVTAVVIPSVWEETFGLVAVEQMMQGRLVIASDVGGLGEVVDQAGLRFPPGDVDGLAACMAQVIDDPGLADRFGRMGRERALSLFGADAMLDEHLVVFRQAAQGIRQAAPAKVTP